MIIIEKNEGTKIPYEVSGKKITFDDDLTINLAKRQADESVHIDICHDRCGELVIGAAAGRSYVAEIDIPAKAYVTTGEGDDAQTEALPLDMDNVTLTLWAMD